MAHAGGWAGLILGGVGWAMIVVAHGTPGPLEGCRQQQNRSRTHVERKRTPLVHRRWLGHLPYWLPLQSL